MSEGGLKGVLDRGETAFGAWINDPELVEVAALAGLDWFFVDLMYTSNDWSRVADLIQAGEAYGIDAVVRTQSNPWVGADRRIAVDVSRLQGIGARYIAVSYSGMDDLTPCLEIAKDWHRKPFLPKVATADGRAGAQRTAIIPTAETKETLADLAELVTHPDVSIAWVAMNDAAKQLSPPGKADWYAPALWKLIDDVVARADEAGTVICGNTGPVPSLTELGERLVHLSRHGVRMIMAQGATLLLYLALQEVLRGVREELGAVRA